MRDQSGWSVENSRPPAERSDEGEMNNTGDILETALILGRWGHTDCYHDAERILRCHLLPSQLRDVSFMKEPENPEGLDRLTNVVDRVRGRYGFPAPYGHEPIGNNRIRFNTDVVGGSVAVVLALVARSGRRSRCFSAIERRDVRRQLPTVLPQESQRNRRRNESVRARGDASLHVLLLELFTAGARARPPPAQAATGLGTRDPA